MSIYVCMHTGTYKLDFHITQRQCGGMFGVLIFTGFTDATEQHTEQECIIEI